LPSPPSPATSWRHRRSCPPADPAERPAPCDRRSGWGPEMGACPGFGALLELSRVHRIGHDLSLRSNPALATVNASLIDSPRETRLHHQQQHPRRSRLLYCRELGDRHWGCVRLPSPDHRLPPTVPDAKASARSG
jgi:hypothetical protein